MKFDSIDVFSIGNALVDYEFQVEDDVFSSLNLQKGLMTLVDKEEQSRILENLDPVNLKKKQSGGSAANSALAIAQLGSNSFYCFKTAGDEIGTFFKDDLEREGVGFQSPIPPDAESHSGQCLVLVTPDAERSMFTYLGASSALGPQDIHAESLKKSRYLYLEGYLVAAPMGFEAMKEARKMAKFYGVKTALCLSDPNMVNFFKPQFKELLKEKVDVLLCNEKEALDFTEEINLPAAVDRLKKHSHVFAVTCGERGSLIWDGQTLHEIPAHKASKAVDTNGAGDMFAGAFLFGIVNQLSFQKTGELASKLCAAVVSQFGPRLTRKNMEKIKLQVLG